MKLGKVLIVLQLVATSSALAATKVDFRDDGICRIDGKPFFPIGCWIYGLDADVLADLHEHHFNTVVGNGLAPAHVPLLEKHGLKCIPMGSDDFVKAAKDSPSLLAWYLTDEPEEHGETPEQVHARYLALRDKDANHPIGITHDMLIGPPKYKSSCDFTMTDVYPVTRDREFPLKAVGEYTDGPRTLHGPGWPNFTFIQTFGGPDTDGGKWAQPLPHEVRFMAFNALVHRASGILYFSYWPRAPITWASITDLNRDIERLVPWLTAPGKEIAMTSTDPAVQMRAKKTENGWLVLTTNTLPREINTTLQVESLGDAEVRDPFAARTRRPAAGQWREKFAAYEAKAYVAGVEPESP